MNGGKLHIRGLDDIAGIFVREDAPVILALLRAIERSPESVLPYRDRQGRDVVDEMIHHARASIWPDECLRAFYRALAAFRDPRVVEFFVGLFLTAERPEYTAFAASRLSQEPPDDLYPRLSACLLATGSRLHARLAAQLLSGASRLTPREKVRSAMLADAPAEGETELSQASAPYWQDELAGPFAADAREYLTRGGAESFAVVREWWRMLSPENREWLLRWGAQVDPLQSAELINRALRSGSTEQIRVALECIPVTGLGANLFKPALSRLQEHPDQDIREAVASLLEVGASPPAQ